MTVPTHVASQSAALTTAGTGPLTCTTSSTTVGDLRLLAVMLAAGVTSVPTTPTGFTLISVALQGPKIYLYARIVGASEPATIDASVSVSTEYVMVEHAYRPSAGSWSDVHDAIGSVRVLANASGSAPDVPALPIVTGDFMLAAFLGHGRGSTTTTQPSGYTMAANPDSGGTSNAAIEGAGAYKSVTGGSASATTWTVTNSAVSGCIHVAIVDPAMSIRALRSARSSVFTTAASFSPDMPRVIQAGDRLVVVITRTGTAGMTPPAGWTQKADASSAADTTTAWERIADGSELGTTPTFTHVSGTVAGVAWAFAFRDSGPLVFAGAADATSDATITIPALTMAAQTPGAVVVAVGALSRGDHLPVTAPSGYTGIYPAQTSTALGVGTGGASGDSAHGAAWLVTTGSNPVSTTFGQGGSSVAQGIHLGTSDVPAGGGAGGSTFYTFAIGD